MSAIPTPTTMPMFETMIRLDEDLRAEIDRDCRRLGVSRAQWLREAARDRLAGTVYRRALGQLLARVQRLEEERQR